MLLGVSSSHLKTCAAFGRVSRCGKDMLLPVAHSYNITEVLLKPLQEIGV